MPSFADTTLRNYLDQLASDAPVPGGGSVSAYVAALAIGLSQMVARITLARKPKAGLSAEDQKKEAEKRAALEKILGLLEKVKKDALEIVDIDPKIYQEVMAAWGGAPEKMEDALNNSFRLQADLALLVVMAREWNQTLADLVAGSIKNDLLVAASLYLASFQGAWHTAMINVKYMQDAQHKSQAEKALGDLKKRFDAGSTQCL